VLFRYKKKKKKKKKKVVSSLIFQMCINLCLEVKEILSFTLQVNKFRLRIVTRIPFDKCLSLDSVLKVLNNSVRTLFSVGGFLRNTGIPLPFKKTIIKSYIISKVSYFAPLLGSNKEKTKVAQQFINLGLYWAAGVHKAKSFTSLYLISKDFNIPPLSAKCALCQQKCYNKWKSSNYIISNLVNKRTKTRTHPWVKESETLIDKLNKIGNIKAIREFYWNRDVKKNSIKAKFYILIVEE